MSRAVILPTPGDPLLLSYWLRNYASWKRYVDQLYVMITWPQTYDVLERCYDDVHAAGGAIIIPPVGYDRVDHGQAIDMMLPGVDETHVVLMEDDVYVRTPEEINACFTLIEGGTADVVGSPRGSCSPEIIEEMQRQGHAHGTALWPHLLFSHTVELRALSESFTCRQWAAGEEVRGLNYHVREDCSSDTGVAATTELRAYARVHEILSDDGDRGDPPWFHVGSLSSGPQPKFASGETPAEAAYGDRRGWARRVAWWNRVLAAWPGGLSDYCKEYRAALKELTEITAPYLRERADRFEELVTW